MNDAPDTAAAAPLAVPLESGVLRATLTPELLLARLSAAPLAAPGLVLAWLGGSLGQRLDAGAVDAAGLLYDEDMLARLTAARAAGRRTVLVHGPGQARAAAAVAAHLDLFDAVADQAPAGAEALAASNSAGGSARGASSARGGSARAVLKALRPHQWMKNVLIFLPLVAAHDFSAWRIITCLLAFVAFSLAASSVYVLNDLLDLAADRAHPRKRKRPFASGAVPLSWGLWLAPGLLVVAFALALAFTPARFVLVLGAYYIATLAYSLTLKRKRVIDICLLAGLYTLRVIAGAGAAQLELSPWMLAFSVFLFLSLAAVKRQAELIDSKRAGKTAIAGRGYTPEDLPVVEMMAMAAGYNSVLVLALYINSAASEGLYTSPLILWGACPVLLYWISRIVMIAHNGGMDDDPVVFAVRDWISRACGVMILGFGLAAAFF